MYIFTNWGINTGSSSSGYKHFTPLYKRLTKLFPLYKSEKNRIQLYQRALFVRPSILAIHQLERCLWLTHSRGRTPFRSARPRPPPRSLMYNYEAVVGQEMTRWKTRPLRSGIVSRSCDDRELLNLSRNHFGDYDFTGYLTRVWMTSQPHSPPSFRWLLALVSRRYHLISIIILIALLRSCGSIASVLPSPW